MASAANDALCERTVEGSVNYYDNQNCKGTSNEKAIAARLGSMTYNIMSNGELVVIISKESHYKISICI